jgi:hypothetical protein
VFQRQPDDIGIVGRDAGGQTGQCARLVVHHNRNARRSTRQRR